MLQPLCPIRFGLLKIDWKIKRLCKVIYCVLMTISKVDVDGFLFQHFSMFQLTHIMQLYYVLEYETKKHEAKAQHF